MDKLGDLPGIADGPQVFESSDVEEAPLACSDDAGSDVDVSVTSRADAQSAFEHYVVADPADFLGHAGVALGDAGYGVAQVRETTKERLARIARELEEIKATEASDPTDDVDTLVRTLEQMDTSDTQVSPYGDRVQAAFDDASTQLARLETLARAHGPVQASSAVVLNLEARIDRLESVLGTSLQTQSLQSQLDEVSRQANLVYNPEYHAKIVGAEVEQLNASVEKYLHNRRLAQIGRPQGDAPPATPKDLKIDEIFARVPQFDKMANALPGILTRLKSLSGVHNEISNCVSTVAEIDNTLGDMRSDMRKWDAAINDVNRRLDEEQSAFDEIKRLMEARLSKLEEH